MKTGSVLRSLGMILLSSGAALVGSCSTGTQSPLSLAPSQPDASVATAVPAGLLEFTITALNPLSDTDTLQVGPITVVALPGQDQAALTRTYVSTLVDALVPVDPKQALTLADYPEARISIQSRVSDQTYFLYQGDFPAVTFDDFVLTFSLSLLPEALRTPDNIVAIANSLFPQRPQPYAAGDLDPVPNATNTDYVAGGQVPAPDLEDVAAVYAAFLLPESLRTADNLSQFIEVIAPALSVAPEDIETIPGETFPGEPIEVVTTIPAQVVPGETVDLSFEITAPAGIDRIEATVALANPAQFQFSGTFTPADIGCDPFVCSASFPITVPLNLPVPNAISGSAEIFDTLGNSIMVEEEIMIIPVSP